jgi:F0F1-type ATP synthase delta subunit
MRLTHTSVWSFLFVYLAVGLVFSFVAPAQGADRPTMPAEMKTLLVTGASPRELRTMLLNEANPAVLWSAWNMTLETERAEVTSYVVLSALLDHQTIRPMVKKAFFNRIFSQNQPEAVRHLMNFIRLQAEGPSAATLAGLIDTPTHMEQVTTRIRSTENGFALGHLIEAWFLRLESKDERLRSPAQEYLAASLRVSRPEVLGAGAFDVYLRLLKRGSPADFEEEWERTRRLRNRLSRLEARFTILRQALRSPALSEAEQSAFLEKVLWEPDGGASLDVFYFLRFRKTGEDAAQLSRLLDRPANVNRMAGILVQEGGAFLLGTLAKVWVEAAASPSPRSARADRPEARGMSRIVKAKGQTPPTRCALEKSGKKERDVLPKGRPGKGARK